MAPAVGPPGDPVVIDNKGGSLPFAMQWEQAHPLVGVFLPALVIAFLIGVVWLVIRQLYRWRPRS